MSSTRRQKLSKWSLLICIANYKRELIHEYEVPFFLPDNYRTEYINQALIKKQESYNVQIPRIAATERQQLLSRTRLRLQQQPLGRGGRF